MKSFALTHKALADLRAIAMYTEQRWGKKQRDLYIRQLDDAFKSLGNAPLVGKPCDYIKEGYRKYPQGRHIIFYRRGSTNTIQIVRILHKSMDIDSKLPVE
jgi:toxin ParE1/3/4